MTPQRRKLLKARIALALREEFSRVPTALEVEKYTRLASVLFRSVGSVIALESWRRRQSQPRLFG